MKTLARVELGIESPEGVESGISINIMDVMLGVGVAVFIAHCFYTTIYYPTNQNEHKAAWRQNNCKKSH